MGYLADGAFFTLCPHLPALSAPKLKRKYKRSLRATMRENTDGDTTNSIIRYHVVQLVLSWISHTTPEFTLTARGPGQASMCFTQDSGTGTVNYPDPKDYLSQE